MHPWTRYNLTLLYYFFSSSYDIGREFSWGHWGSFANSRIVQNRLKLCVGRPLSLSSNIFFENWDHGEIASSTSCNMISSDNFYHTPIRYGVYFPKATWASFSNTRTIFLVWSNLPKTLFWQVHNFFLSYFQDNLKTWSGRPNINIQDPHMVWKFSSTHNLWKAFS